ncbi:hypothetical protein XocVXO32_21285, partial [Xanthomonas oryzae pv. oryzicola]|uniref:hypothetical protein n=1 Tax=Xanthomonas oryzae TaxID=347 RepID=UPI003CE81723
LALHGIDAHRATSLASGDNSICSSWRRSCDCWLRVRANQAIFCAAALLAARDNVATAANTCNVRYNGHPV